MIIPDSKVGGAASGAGKGRPAKPTPNQGAAEEKAAPADEAASVEQAVDDVNPDEIPF
jgi:hypothetical protein